MKNARQHPLLALPALAAAALTLIAAMPQTAGAWTGSVYATNFNDGKVSQYDVGAAGALSAKSPDSVGAGSFPRAAAVSPDGKSLYVADSLSFGVWQFEIGAGGQLAFKAPTVPTGSVPRQLAISPDGKSLYVVNQIGDSISQYDIGAGGALAAKTPATVAAGNNPNSVVVSPDGKSLYVANPGSVDVSQYDIGAGGLLSPKSPATVVINTGASDITITPDGTSVYVTDPGLDDVWQFDVTAGGLLSPKSPDSVHGPGSLGNLVVSPDSKSLYASGGSTAAQWDIGAGGLLSPKSPFTVPAQALTPAGIAITPDGKNLYMADPVGGEIPQFDIGGGGLLSPKSPAEFSSPYSTAMLAVTPDQPPAAQVTVTTGTKAASLDGSASTDSDGSIAKYEWNFGDGQTGSGAKVDHAYAKAGTYTATLTLTDDIGCSTQQVWQGRTAYCNGSSGATKSVQVDVGSTLSGLHVDPGFFRADSKGKVLTSKKYPRGSELRYKLTADSPVEFTIQKRVPGRKVGGRCVKPKNGNASNRRCGRGFRKQTSSFTLTGKAGQNKAEFSARLSSGNLSWGVYRLKAVAAKNGVSSAPRYSYFKIAHP